jgi:hypothetical protein
MRTMTATWRELAPKRGALGQIALHDSEAWTGRLHFDRERAAQHQSPELSAITQVVRERACAAGAAALLLTGSTARDRRTRVSDLDYHVIGTASLQVADLPEDIDLYTDETDRFWGKLREGDDFAHWSVWYGCVLFDSGVIREAVKYVAEQNAWPDSDRKLLQARRALDFADQLLESGDYGAALEQVRGTLSLTARWLLLSHDVFPLARDELSEQLEQLGQAELAAALRCSIRERPSNEYLCEALRHVRSITEGKSFTSERFAA